ncbi:hypothetical protein BGZ72_007662 [Mortierella alpina]|nr:hypothetical protein BGZ72_007662 [Mortierella alpina]
MPYPKMHALLPARPSEVMSNTSHMSPFDIPEIASLIVSFIPKLSDLARCARVSRSLHDICIPFLWKDVPFRKEHVGEGPRFDQGYHVGFFRYGRLGFIKELTIYDGSDGDMEMIAENCPGLKVLNCYDAQVTTENLAILIPSDRNQAREGDLDGRSKRRKTRFPSHLESVSIISCRNLTGPACLEIVSLLGPQLKRLSLHYIKGIIDQDMIKFVRRCPNLVDLQFMATTITDGFLLSFAREFLPSDSISSSGSRRQLLKNLNLDKSEVSGDGILPVVMACRSTLKTLSAQFVKDIDDKVLFALVKDPVNKNATESSKVVQDLTTPTSTPDHAGDNTPIMHHRFSPNTVLTEIRLGVTDSLTDAGYQVLFRFATELVSIELDRCGVEDGALMVLAETYRSRMEALGLGVPAAWRQHVLAEEGVQAMARDEAAIYGSKSSSDSGIKVFKNGHVPGGLRRLHLRARENITNKGVRAILRSCVGLEFLDIGKTFELTLELFNGPWACSGIKDLNISWLALEVAAKDLENGEDGLKGYEAKHLARYREELLESLRFPLSIDPYPQEDDFDEDGDYDHMARPIGKYDGDCELTRENTPRRRAILREFYSKLGQLSQLRTFVMDHCKFRVRVKDGLELALPGLQQNLIDWKFDLGYGYQMGNSELEFIGKHFGYGDDFAVAEDDGHEQWEFFGEHFGYGDGFAVAEDDGQEQLEFFDKHFGYGDDFAVAEDDGQEQLEIKTRKAQLKHLSLKVATMRRVRPEVLYWAKHQGFHLDVDDGLWYN